MNRPFRPALLAFVTAALLGAGCNELLGIREGHLAPTDDDATDGGHDDVDGGRQDPDGGSHDVDGGSRDPDGGSHDVDGGSRDPDGGGHDVDGGSQDPDGGDPLAACPRYDVSQGCQPQYLSDDENCCVAGRSCQGGRCDAGHCLPVDLVAGAGWVSDVAVVDGTLYYPVCGGSWRRCPTDGGACADLWPHNDDCAAELVPYGGRLFYQSGNGLRAMPLDGSGGQVVVATLPFGQTASGRQLVIGAGRAFWTMSSPPSLWFAELPSSGVVEAVPLALASDAGLGWFAGAGGATCKALVDGGSWCVDGAVSPLSVALDDEYVYWSDVTGAEPNGTIRRRRLSNLGQSVPAEVLRSEEVYLGFLAVDATRLYWTGYDGQLPGGLRSMAKRSPGTPMSVASDVSFAEYLQTDGRYVYWMKNVGGSGLSGLQRALKGGGPVEDVALMEPGTPGAFTQDCDTLYWGTGDGHVRKVAK